MSLTIRAIAASFALLTTSFNQAASEPESEKTLTLPLALPLPEKPELQTTQEEIVHAAVADFRESFIARVRANDRRGKWDRCYSTTNQDYDPRVVAELRQTVPEGYTRMARTFFNPEEETAQLSISNLTRINFPASETASELQVNKPIVVIDFGHGQRYRRGYETGANEDGVHEAKVADAVGRQLTRILEEEYGLIVVNTRSSLNEKSGFDLDNQTRFKNQDKSLQIRGETLAYLDERFPDVPKVFVSIHTNRAVGLDGNILPNISGGLVFSYSPHENGRSASTESQALSRHIASQYSLRKRTYARTNDYAVLRCQHQNTAAVLLELGFNTNPSDRAVFQSILSNNAAAYKYASNIAKGIGDYFSEREKRQPLVETQIAINMP